MKNILRDTLGRFKSLKINLLDGQRKGEIIFRRVFLILIVYLLVLFIGKALTNKPEETPREAGAIEIVNGQKIQVDENGKTWYIQEYTPKPEKKAEVVVDKKEFNEYEKIYKFTQTYGGSRISARYFSYLKAECKTPEVLRTVIAISVAETGMGRDVKRQSNFYGWFAGGNRNYDPDQKTMAKVICSGIAKSYMGVQSNRTKAVKYVGTSDVSSWMRNVNWAYNQMR